MVTVARKIARETQNKQTNVSFHTTPGEAIFSNNQEVTKQGELMAGRSV
jgi:hypothetical protein